jgi:methyltransferase (TIGR00027 family)
MRAAESLLPDARRLFTDPLALDLVRRPRYRLLCSRRSVARLALSVLDHRCPGLHGHIVLRGRYADAEVTRAYRDGIRQIVLLGAGFDTTAYRHRHPDLVVFEVDAPMTQRVKRARITAGGHRTPSQVSYVPCDFAGDRLSQALLGSGYRADHPALVLWFGVTCYLTPEAVHTALGDLRAVTVSGSRLVLDYVDAEVADGTSRHPGARRVAQMVADRGEPYRSGFTPRSIAAVLTEHGFIVDDDIDLPRLAALFRPDGVWCSIDGWQHVTTAHRS